MAKAIDFQDLKKRITFEDVLSKTETWQHYKQAPKQTRKGPCPGCGSKKGLTIYIATNSFYCFQCKAGADIIDFVMMSEQLKSLRKAAELLLTWFPNEASTSKEGAVSVTAEPNSNEDTPMTYQEALNLLWQNSGKSQVWQALNTLQTLIETYVPESVLTGESVDI